MKKCLILDYDVGNISSIRTFFRDNNYVVDFGNSAKDIAEADLLILPGVGSFNTAATAIDRNGSGESIRNRHSANKPILGICLGFQLLTQKSAESPDSNGLGIFNGTTKRLKEYSRIGWGKIECAFEENYGFDDYFYFNHSFGIYDVSDSRISAFSGSSRYRALTVVNNTVGVQFHPERSQKSGKEFLMWLEKNIWNSFD
jgi:glutamine amidotransferase